MLSDNTEHNVTFAIALSNYMATMLGLWSLLSQHNTARDRVVPSLPSVSALSCLVTLKKEYVPCFRSFVPSSIA